ncbi:MAG: inositol monophosphatase [Microthrixaceae bacterium]|nr:inositol monophosphatase [Acidimicrobiales bacterium]MCB9404315.1 inositol monophosphatase [Microthrixaceae bacterium]
MNDPRSLLALARPVAEEVAAELVRALDGDARAAAVSSKSTGTDLVTEMDRWAELHITERLLAARPTDSIVGEEGADVTGTSDITWCIDPIDGTVNFVHAMPGFCVSIAAQTRDAGGELVTVAAVVASPLHGDVFTAVRGGGAFRNDRVLRCASPVSLARSVVGTGFGYDPARRARQAEVVAQIIGEVADIRRSGAAALDLCWVACGRLDGYWEVGLNPWDHAAASLITSEAGARCEGLRGAAPSSDFVLAAPAEVFEELHDLLLAANAAAV